MNKSIIDHRIVSSRYFFPRPEQFENPFRVDCGEAQLACYYRQINPDAKTIVFFHGYGEVVADYIEFFVPLFDRLGCNSFLAEYRGYGMSTGDPGLVSMLADVETMINTLGLPPEKLIFFGRSVGSIYAVHGASLFPNAGGLILESGIADVFERLLLRVSPEELNLTIDALQIEVEKHFNTKNKLQKYKGSVLVMHAKHDSLVHFAHGQKLYQWAGAAEESKTLKIFEQGDHNDIFPVNAHEYVRLLDNFVRTL